MNNFFRKLPAFTGKARLARIFCRRFLNSKKDLVVSGKYNCKYLLPNLKETVAFEIFINGIYEEETSDLFFNSLPRNAVFLDLGANIGAITIPLLKRRTDIKVICVEAAPWLAEYLEKNIILNGIGNTTIINKALYNQDNLELKFFSPKDKFGKGSLSPVFTNDDAIVKTITLDRLVNDLGIKKVDVIKIDVEGYEYFTFKGGEKLLKDSRDLDILFESVDWAETQAGLESGSAQALLLDYGYTLYKINKKGKFQPLSEIMRTGSELLFASKRAPGNFH